MDIEVDAKGINLSTEEVVDYLGDIINIGLKYFHVEKKYNPVQNAKIEITRYDSEELKRTRFVNSLLRELVDNQQ